MSDSDPQASVKQALNLNPLEPKPYRKLLILAVALLIPSGIAVKMLFFKDSPPQPQLQFETVPLKRGDLTVVVTATGKLEPLTQVEIGIEVSGTVAEIYADFNDHVKAGQVLAKLDPRLFDARVKQSQGTLDQAQAKLVDAQATVAEKQQILEFMQQARKLSNGSVPAKQDIVAAEANLKRAKAQVSAILGSISQAEGQLKLDKTNLIKSSIRTPIDGIVLDRKIEKGQTVAASLQTPVMFKVANNLQEMKLYVDVDEADVGKIKLGQPASFTVDAYPEKTFPASISEIRYAPQTVGGVVTYQTVLRVSNADLLLRPGMTATADMIVSQAKNVLILPNAALRFNPHQNGNEKKTEPSFLDKLLPRGPRMPRPPKKVQEKKRHKKSAPKIWILEHQQPKEIAVQLGLNDGEMTEVFAPELKEGMAVITDSLSNAK